eukprot:663513-Amphidinium_carterae.1
MFCGSACSMASSTQAQLESDEEGQDKAARIKVIDLHWLLLRPLCGLHQRVGLHHKANTNQN